MLFRGGPVKIPSPFLEVHGRVPQAEIVPLSKAGTAITFRGDARMSDVPMVLDAIQADDPEAPAQLLPLVYEELRQTAATRPRPTPKVRCISCAWGRPVSQKVGV